MKTKPALHLLLLTILLHPILLRAQHPSKHDWSREPAPFSARLRNLLNGRALFDSNPSLHPGQSPRLSDDVQEAWVSRYGSGLAPGFEGATGVAVDGSGNVYVTGYSTNRPFGLDYLTARYDAAGNLVWTARYNGEENGDDLAFSIAVDAAMNVYVTGQSFGSNTNFDCATVKYNSSGVQQWVARYNGPGNDSDGGEEIAIDGSGNVYVTGFGKGSGTFEDYATIKYNSAGVQQWVARYNGPGNSVDLAYTLAVDGSGNVYVTGQSIGSGAADDYATIKYNASGVQQWEARYNGPGNSIDRATALAIDAASNVYVTGWSLGSGTNNDYATIKYSASGVQQWESRYNGPGNSADLANALAVDPASGDVYVTGSSVGSATSEDYATVKYNSSGVQQWVTRFNGSGNSSDLPNALTLDATGNVYVTGRSFGASDDYATIKYNSSGVQQWVAGYDGPGNSGDFAIAIAVDGSANVYVTGLSKGSGTEDDYATIKYNSSGVRQWEARYNGPGNSIDLPHALAVDAAGNVYVTGESESSGTLSDYATIKYNSAGAQQWVARYNGPGNSADRAKAIAVDGAGNVYVTGQSEGLGASSDYATIKYSSAGAEQWVVRYNGPGNSEDFASAIAVDGSGNVYVTGLSKGSGTDDDYATIKYNASGVQQWVARYNGPGSSTDQATALALDATGNVYVTGRSIGSGTSEDYATIKYNSSGAQQWVERYNNAAGGSFDRATALVVDAAGNVYVTGESFDSGTSGDYATIKYNSSGLQQWVARYNGAENRDDRALALAVDASGNVYVTGVSRESIINEDYATIKYNSSGVQQWVARYNGPRNSTDQATALALDAAGNVYVTGQSADPNTLSDYVTIKYNSSGIQQWLARYNGPENYFDEAIALAVDAEANVYVTGATRGLGGSVYTTIKYVQGQPNRPPVVANPILNQVLTVGGASFMRDLNASPAVFNDPDGDALSYTVSLTGANVAMASLSASTLTISPVAMGKATVIIIAKDSRSGMDTTTFMVMVNQSPNPLPVIFHLTPSPQPAGQAILIQANITDDVSVASATLSYRRGGDTSFTAVAMATNGGSLYQGTIPASTVTSRGVEYFLAATDVDTNTTRQPATGIFSLPIQVTNETRPTAQPSGSVPTAYRLISVPLQLNDPSATAVLEDDLRQYSDTVWRLFGLVPGQPLSNKSPYTELSQTGAFTPGRSFFLILKEPNKTIDAGPGQSVRTDQKFSITLEAGHNFIATPFNFDIPKSRLSLQNGGVIDLQTYAGNWAAENAKLSPWEGYYLPNNRTSPDILFVNPDLSPGAVSPRAEKNDAGVWRMRILAHCGEAADTYNFAGVSSTSEDGWDESDLVEAPPIGEYVALYFPHAEWRKIFDRYREDIRSTGNPNQRWRFVVETNLANELVTLRFDGLNAIAAELAVFLVDEALQYKQNLRENAVYQYQPRHLEPEKKFTLLVGKEEFVAEQTAGAAGAPAEFVLEQNFPNPFWSEATSPAFGGGNPETAIRFGLPEKSVVTIKIFDLAGREIAALLDRVELPAGRHQRVWNGRDAQGQAVVSGIYFCRLVAGSFSRQMKMSLVR